MSKIQRWTDRSNDPLFDTLFAFQKSDQVELPFTLEEQYSTAEYAVSMELETGPDRMLTRLSFEVDVLPPQQAQIMLKQYVRRKFLSQSKLDMPPRRCSS